MPETSTYEDEAREIGTEHGRNAASWVELDEATAEQIDRDGMVFEIFPELNSPLSGEWADGYLADQLLDDVGFPEDQRVELGGGIEADITDAYEDAYWQAFEAEVLRKVEAMRGPTLDIDEDQRYQVAGWPKIAFSYVGQTFGGRARVVMVGDNKEHIVDPEDLSPVDDYCRECGQVGCQADGRSE